jgi:hypothetical protein
LSLNILITFSIKYPHYRCAAFAPKSDNEKIHIPYNLVDAMFEIPPEEIGKIGYDPTKQDAPFPDPGYRST